MPMQNRNIMLHGVLMEKDNLEPEKIIEKSKDDTNSSLDLFNQDNLEEADDYNPML